MTFTAGCTLQVETPGSPGTWNAVTTSSSYVRVAAGAATDADAITASQVGAGSGSIVNGEYDEGDGACTTNLAGLSHNNYAFSVQFRSADLSGGETVNLRLIETGGSPMTNDSPGTISATIETPSGPAKAVFGYHQSMITS